MAIKLTATVVGEGSVRRYLRKIDPSINKGIPSDTVKRVAEQMRDVSKKRFFAMGRGNAPPLPDILTNRSGRLRNSIAVDKSALPKAASVGTDVPYGAVHEFGFRTTPKRPFLAPAARIVVRDLEKVALIRWRRAIF